MTPAEYTILEALSRTNSATIRVLCPICSAERHGPNRMERTCVVTRSGRSVAYYCHHCGASGAVRPEDKPAPPPPVPISPRLDQIHLKWLQARGISIETAQGRGLYSTTMNSKQQPGEQVGCVAFPYKDGGKVVGIKYRTPAKEFSQMPGSAQILWGLDRVKDPDTLVIVEGEMDALALDEAGIPNALSVPGGAPNKVSDASIQSDDRRFAFLRHSERLLQKAKRIVLAVDADEPGRALQEELARRLGKARCWLVTWPQGCKDANDCLKDHGKEAVKKCVDAAEAYPVDGVYGAETYLDQYLSIYRSNGVEVGYSTGYRGLDELFKVVPGQLTVVTGHPAGGKSSFVDQLMVNLAHEYGWHCGIMSFENQVAQHMSRLAELHMGKPFLDIWAEPRMTEAEAISSGEWIRQHFQFVDFGSESPSLTAILDKAQTMVLRAGIKGLVIDPYNYIDLGRSRDTSETESISRMLSQVRQFAKTNDCHVWFVAHPAKMLREGGKVPVPTGYDISGSAAWFAKADIGMTVHRPDRHAVGTELHVWKVRYKWVGREGVACFQHHLPTSGFVETGKVE